jgi:putative ABC transport system permease protein
MYTGGKEFDDRYFRFQLEKAHELLKTEKVESLVLGLSSHDIWDEIKTHVESRFPKLMTYSVDEIDKILFKQSEIWLDGQHKFLKLIIIIVILLGIFNATSTAIFGRKKEVGILRANGDSVLNIIKQFTLEVFIISFFAATIGMFLVLILCSLIAHAGGIVMPPGPGYTDYFIVVVKPSVNYFLGTLIISISCSVIATIFATLRTASLPTIKALKGI